MKNGYSKWVVGHKITTHDTTGNYDLAVIETPAKVQGPPPHTHQSYNESFMVIDGEVQFFIDGEIKTLRAGEVIDIPPHTLHTFENVSNKPSKLINIHSPKGFRGFFEEMGISEEEKDAQMKSVAPEMVEKVIQSAASFDMHIKM